MPDYPSASEVPRRLYFGLRPKNMVYTQQNGLRSSSRPFIALCADRELALRIAKRREQAPILIEILAGEASENGISFLVAGPHLYLAQSVPVEFILFPKIRHGLAEGPEERVPKRKDKPAPAPSPGSFTVQPHHLQAGKDATNKPRGGWKKVGRKDRHKRDI
jgi:putative RNA 2'-phosphotransferase